MGIVSDRWQPGAAVARALLRPGTYAGYLREAGCLAVGALAFPLGMIDQSPRPARRRACGQATLPVVLVHGYGHNRSAWLWLSQALRREGVADLETMNYNPFAADVPACGERLRLLVDAVRRRTGADQVDVVGHSMGGVVARWMIQECDGYDAVRTCLTIATPHSGTVMARLGPGRTARQLRPGSPVIRRLADSLRPSDVRFVAYYSNIDALVQPASSAKLTHQHAQAENVLVRDLGHMGILLSPWLAADVARRLTAPAVVSASAPAPLAA